MEYEETRQKGGRTLLAINHDSADVAEEASLGGDGVSHIEYTCCDIPVTENPEENGK